MEEKRTCYNCGARLRPGARFCSECGSIVRVNRANEQVVNVEEQPKPVETPIKETKRHEVKSEQQELYFYEKPSKKSKGPKKEKQQKQIPSFDLAGDNALLWNCLTSVTSVIALILGIILLCSNFMSVTFEGYQIALSMNDCFDVLFSRDIPIFYEITVEVGSMCSAIAVCGLLYLLVSIGYLGYNLVMYGKYNKLILLINTAFSAVLTVLSLMLLIFYIMIKGQCGAVGGVSNYYSFSIILLIITVVVLLLDIVKLTILYQNKVAAQDNPSYILNFVSSFGRNIWKLASIIGGCVGAVALLVIILLATAKHPAIKVWENYVEAFNKESYEEVSECYYPLGTDQNQQVQDLYQQIFAAEGKTQLAEGKTTVLLQTDKYIKLSVSGVAAESITLHLGKVDKEWYFMSYVDVTSGGNKVAINSFNQEVAETILKINDTTVRGFSLILGDKDIDAISEIVIPEGITKIEAGAFAGLEYLQSVTIPNSVKVIEAGAFKGCTSLVSVKLSNQLVSLGESAFEGCSVLEEVVLSETVTTVGKNAFNDCTSLTIYTNYNTTPEGFNADWNPDECKVYLDKQWGNNPDNPERIHLLTIESNGGEYELEDDEYFETGEFAILPVPTQVGCEFLGWYTTPDFQEGSKVSTSNNAPTSIKMEGDVTVYAKWNENVYNIKYNLDGGTLENMVTTYTVGDVVVLGTPTKKGYTFVGWTGTGLDKETEIVEFAGETGDREYTAVFKANIYTITFDPNGGTGTGKILVTFGTTAKLTVNNFNYSGMKLVEWNTEADGTGTSYKINQEIPYNDDSDMTLYAIWASLITLDPGTNATVEGSIPRITYGQKTYSIPVPTTNDYVFFAGWYLGEQQITNSEGEGLKPWSMNSAVTLTAKWVEKITVDGITYLYRGEYPQSRVTDADLIEELSKLKTTNDRGYYSYNGEQYAKVVYSNAEKDDRKFNDGTKLVYNKTYFFKVEKILWRVIDEEKSLLVSELVLDAIAYYDDNDNRTYYDTHLGYDVTVTPNNYMNSNLDAWLNNSTVDRYDLEIPEVNYTTNGFATKSFEDVTKDVQFTLDIDNSLESTLADTNAYVTGNSEGFFFALSHKEFKVDYASVLSEGLAGATDYAIAREVEFDEETSTASWWLRSPSHNNRKYALRVNTTGGVSGELVTNTAVGVRPAMYLR